jgi:enoyl-CoA hydratase/carnithine racemase
MTNSLKIEQHGTVTLVALNRPEKRNALDDETVSALSDFFAHPPKGTRVIVLHGIGEHFCARLDLVEKLRQKGRTSFDVVKASQRWHRAFEKIQFGECPVICAMHGGVIGGGMELAASTHVRIAEESTFFQLPEAQRGIFVGGATVRVARIIGPGRMIEMMLSGRRNDAEVGMSLGLAHYVVPDGQALAKATEIAAQIAQNAGTSNFELRDHQLHPAHQRHVDQRRPDSRIVRRLDDPFHGRRQRAHRGVFRRPSGAAPGARGLRSPA